jgi:hypothetical protein
VQFIAAFAPMPIKRLQKKAYVSFDGEQLSAVVRRECNEISSRRGKESSRLQKRTSAAESRASFETLNWHEWNSCPSRLFFVANVVVSGKVNFSRWNIADSSALEEV